MRTRRVITVPVRGGFSTDNQAAARARAHATALTSCT
jgi:hypothetical protein